jgi:hypothetical protein
MAAQVASIVDTLPRPLLEPSWDDWLPTPTDFAALDHGNLLADPESVCASPDVRRRTWARRQHREAVYEHLHGFLTVQQVQQVAARVPSLR